MTRRVETIRGKSRQASTRQSRHRWRAKARQSWAPALWTSSSGITSRVRIRTPRRGASPILAVIGEPWRGLRQEVEMASLRVLQSFAVPLTRAARKRHIRRWPRSRSCWSQVETPNLAGSAGGFCIGMSSAHHHPPTRMPLLPLLAHSRQRGGAWEGLGTAVGMQIWSQPPLLPLPMHSRPLGSLMRASCACTAQRHARAGRASGSARRE